MIRLNKSDFVDPKLFERIAAMLRNGCDVYTAQAGHIVITPVSEYTDDVDNDFDNDEE